VKTLGKKSTIQTRNRFYLFQLYDPRYLTSKQESNLTLLIRSFPRQDTKDEANQRQSDRKRVTLSVKNKLYCINQVTQEVELGGQVNSELPRAEGATMRTRAHLDDCVSVQERPPESNVCAHPEVPLSAHVSVSDDAVSELTIVDDYDALMGTLCLKRKKIRGRRKEIANGEWRRKNCNSGLVLYVLWYERRGWKMHES